MTTSFVVGDGPRERFDQHDIVGNVNTGGHVSGGGAPAHRSLDAPRGWAGPRASRRVKKWRMGIYILPGEPPGAGTPPVATPGHQTPQQTLRFSRFQANLVIRCAKAFGSTNGHKGLRRLHRPDPLSRFAPLHNACPPRRCSAVQINRTPSPAPHLHPYWASACGGSFVLRVYAELPTVCTLACGVLCAWDDGIGRPCAVGRSLRDAGSCGAVSCVVSQQMDRVCALAPDPFSLSQRFPKIDGTYSCVMLCGDTFL